MRPERSLPFISKSPRFNMGNRITIFTGQDSKTGNLYIIKDDKTNLGPGYYKDQNEIARAREYYKNIMRDRRHSQSIYGGPCGFSSTSSRYDGSVIKAAVHSSASASGIGFYGKRS